MLDDPDELPDEPDDLPVLPEELPVLPEEADEAVPDEEVLEVPLFVDEEAVLPVPVDDDDEEVEPLPVLPWYWAFTSDLMSERDAKSGAFPTRLYTRKLSGEIST